MKDIMSRAPTVRERENKPAPVSSAHQQWLDEILERVFQLIHNIEHDNFDSDRYPNEPPNVFFYERHVAYFKFLIKNVEHFFAARQLFTDDVSRALYDQLILFRILGHLHVRLPFNVPQNRAQGDIANAWRVDEAEEVGHFGNLAIFVTPTSPYPIRVKCWKENIAATFLQRQYYFTRDDVTIAPAKGDHLIDAGGCFGDTALEFAMTIGDQGHVYTFDPIPKHCAIIRENLAMNPILAPRISVHEVGLAANERVGKGQSAAEGKINPGATAFDASISTTTIDKFSQNGMLPRIDFIKMDIEGSELDALRGAESVIREHIPRLAISLYHRPEDFFAIPLWIDQLNLGYRLFLEHYSIHNEETILYASV
jgi:FkbM family methyltransferase